jgi:Ca2+-binding RTX toxin-like protein
VANIVGTSGNDTLSGTAGDDTISGSGGNDVFLVGSTGGNDLIDGGAGFDSIEFKDRATSAVVVDFASGTITGGSSGTISFTNVERIVAGIFNDRLTGNAASQTLTGQAGSDTLWGAGGADTLWGGADADTFVFRETGTANADRINDFASGSDKILLDASVMSALGASGNLTAGDARFAANSTGSAQDASDRIIFNTTTKQLFYDADGSGSGSGAVLIATLQSGATLVDTDVVVEGGTAPGGAQTINGTSGNDSLVGGPGNDTINGFDGEDTIDGAAGADSMVGGAHADTYFVDNPGDVIVEFENGGFDTVHANVSYTLAAWVNHLTLTGTASINGTGNELPNVITGNSGDNELDGADGDDTLVAGAGRDNLFGGAGNDEMSGGEEVDYLNAGAGQDSLFGGAGDDFVELSTFGADSGDDTVDGGTGIDHMSYTGARSALIVDFAAGTITGGHADGGGQKVFANIENFISGDHADRVIGDSAANILQGGFGSDTIEGGAGNDTIYGGIAGNLSDQPEVLSGGAGNDLLTGGRAADTFIFRETGTANADRINDFISSGGPRALELGVDKIVLDASVMTALGASGNFTAGDARFAANSTGTAQDASDRVIFNTTTKQLFYDADGSGSGSGAVLIATLQSDQIVNSSATLVATDIVVEGGAGPAPIVGTEGNDSLTGTNANDIIDGLGGNDTLRGLEGDDSLLGGDGDDSLVGHAGRDRVEGGAGSDRLLQATWDNDTLDGGIGVDTLLLQTADSAVTVDLAAGTMLGGDSAGTATATLLNIEFVDAGGVDRSVHMIGTSGNNFLRGGTAADRIFGGDGDDTIYGSSFEANANGDDLSGGAGNDLISAFGGNGLLDGGTGNDVLAGGTGIDRFLFSVAPGEANRDHVAFFAAGTDKLIFASTAFPDLGPSGSFSSGDDRFAAFIGSGTPSGFDAEDRVLYNVNTGELWYDPDGNGSRVAQRVATLQDSPSLTANDIAVDAVTEPAGGQTINGTSGNDSLVGGPGNDTIDGLGGDDTIRGLGGNDSLLGGYDGFDYVDGGDGDDTLIGTGGFDSDQTLVGGAGNDVLVGYWGNDVYEGGSGADIFQDENGSDFYVYRTTSEGGDEVWDADDFERYVFDHAGFSPIGTTTFAPNDPRFYAAAGAASGHDADDRIIYDTASGRLYYDTDGSGSDAATLIATIAGSPALSATNIVVAQFDSSGNWIIAGSPGDDRLTAAAGDDTINGAAGNDTLSGGRGANRLIGGDGNDELIGANDTLDGGFGDDVYWVGRDGVILSDPGGVDTVVAIDSDWTLGAGLENLRFSFADFGGAPLTGIGNELNNTIHGGEFGGTLRGMGGNDLLVAYPRGASRATDMHGGDGDDTLEAGTSDDASFGDAGNDLLIAAPYGNNSLTGGSGADRFLFDEAPADATGVDTIADFLSATDKIVLDGNAYANSGPSGTFAAGDARFWSSGTGTAHDADDRVIYNTSNGQLWYDADGTGSGGAQLIATLPQGQSGETPANLAASDIAIINGSTPPPPPPDEGEVINGTSGNDTLSGTDGNDTINGLGGNDLLLAGSTGGADVFDGGTGFDSIEFRERATSAVVVDFVAGTISGGSSGTISFANVERVLGGNFDDILTGNAASQNLTGRHGADTLWGAGGVDTLWGGGDGNTFIFRETGTANADSIRDWASGLDTLVLDNAAMSALGAEGDFVAGDARFAWGSGFTSGRDASDRVVFDTSTGRLYYDADGSGSGAAQLIATVQSGATVAATDIVVI